MIELTCKMVSTPMLLFILTSKASVGNVVFDFLLRSCHPLGRYLSLTLTIFQGSQTHWDT